MTTDSGWVKKLAAVSLVVVLVGIVAAALVQFVGGFTKTVPVTVTSARAGLVMEPDAKVKLLGVEVGRVGSIEYVGEQAVLNLDMQPDMMSRIPANSRVDIKSTTVFGAKYVNIVEPEQPSSRHLEPGAVIASDSVTVEFDTVFQHLSDVLAQVEPEKLNATLGAVSSALQGRGDALGETLERGNSYLAKMNPSLPRLQEDLAKAADVTHLYADTAPDLLRTVDNASATSDTVVDQQGNLDSLLLNVIGLADTTNGVLTENEQNLTTALSTLSSTTGLLNEYSSELSCLIVGLNNVRPVGERMFGGNQPAIALSTNFVPGAEPYTYPRDLPKVNASGGPACYGLPDPDPNTHADFVVADTGNQPYVPSTQLNPDLPNAFQFLFEGVLPEGGR
ncbi:MCE family protein [Rhodococcus sp. HNM0569]|uniref:MCE family protein n=1 Tax=Rhodococcus sp. HNM0569 TaxID=2716340 RepID=UPI00146C710E|nr:MCE family protein [Rhodococcus sp. HNM0569]NLU82263.1 MCE family protein [Rhodococcus sp. HNM0569]